MTDTSIRSQPVLPQVVVDMDGGVSVFETYQVSSRYSLVLLLCDSHIAL
jgi:hypothetical protein